jgi:hypothetical protein
MPLLVPAAIAGLLALVFAGHAFVNYDTAYALLWGGDLAAGRTPDLELDLAPTPHPLANVAGMVLGAGAAEVLAFVWLGIAGFLVFRLASVWFGVAAGVVAAVLFLTREPVLSFGVRAYVDLPFLCLVLGALLIEARRPRAGWPVLALLALAGLLRPEPWLFSAAYVLWLRDWRLLPLAAAGPVLWALHDLLLTGNPLWSLTGTQDNAQELGRRTGPVDLVLYGPRRLGEILREPVLAGLVLGAAYAWRARVRLPLVALGLALGAFAVLATAGLPIITRYLLVPAALACVLCGGVTALGLRAVPWAALRRSPQQTLSAHPWLVGSIAVTVLLVAFAPGQVRRIDRLERSIRIQERILADLDALPAAALRCRPLAVTNRRPVPHLALRFDDVEPRDVLVGRVDAACTYVGPASRAVAEDFVFDPRDPVRELPRLPPAFRRVAANRSWTVLAR